MQRVSSAHNVTVLLQAWGNGSIEALDDLAPLVYRELHLLAERLMNREHREHTLQATALVNEAYLRPVDTQQVNWRDRAHLFAICARTMRQIPVDHARPRDGVKRGGGQKPQQLDEALVTGGTTDSDLLELDDALKRLAEQDPRKSHVAELCFLGSLSVEETAEALEISPETVRRDWKLAMA